MIEVFPLQNKEQRSEKRQRGDFDTTVQGWNSDRYIAEIEKAFFRLWGDGKDDESLTAHDDAIEYIKKAIRDTIASSQGSDAFGKVTWLLERLRYSALLPLPDA